MAYTPYATVSDLVCEVDDTSAAEALIARASRMIDAACGETAPDPDIAKDVCCAMVERVLAAYAADLVGIKQASETAGPYTWSGTYSNPGGDLYITKAEKRSLGVGLGSLGFARPSYGRLEADDGQD